MKATHSIEIFTSQNAVWDATVKLESWSTWTPTVEYIKPLTPGKLAPGNEVIIKQPNLPELKWKVSEIQPESLFKWHSNIRGVPVIATHRIENRQGSVINHLSFEMKGFLATLLWPFVRKQIKRSIKIENMGIKDYCENEFSGQNDSASNSAQMV